MPNFTEGGWYELKGQVVRPLDNGYEVIASTANPSDARLMAQSKKMYEVLKKISDRGNVEPFMDAIELYGCCPFTGNEWMGEVDAILSEIDKEQICISCRS